MADMSSGFFREQLLDRRRRLESALVGSQEESRLTRLLGEVDDALARMELGTYGICEVCREPVETARLYADPLARYCLDHLTARERSALERDLEAAAGLQRGLLPSVEASHDGWEIAHAYRPLGAVSGDYCDVILEESPERNLFFFVGDVSGKGVAAAMLTTQLHAIFRTLIFRRTPVAQLIGQASRIFCASALAPYYATLVGGRVGANGSVEISNAGHCPPLVIRGKAVTRLQPSGVPLGMFSDGEYRSERLELDPGDALVLYTDGVSEARNAEDAEYGEERVIASVRNWAGLSPRAAVTGCLQDLDRFLGSAILTDDLTVMAIQRSPCN